MGRSDAATERFARDSEVESMDRSTTISDPNCPNCQKLMDWHSALESGAQRMNVFYCKTCGTFVTALASGEPGKLKC